MPSFSKLDFSDTITGCPRSHFVTARDPFQFVRSSPTNIDLSLISILFNLSRATSQLEMQILLVARAPSKLYQTYLRGASEILGGRYWQHESQGSDAGRIKHIDLFSGWARDAMAETYLLLHRFTLKVRFSFNASAATSHHRGPK